MPRLLHNIKNSLLSRIRQFDPFPVSLIICLIGFLAHFSFVFLFRHWGVPSLSYFNVISSLLWVWALAEVLRGFIYRAIFIVSSEILLHAVVAVSVLGHDSGFDLYLWPLAAWLAYHPVVKHRFALIAGSASIILWFLGRIYWSHVSDVPVSADILAMMLIMNAAIASIGFILVIISARMVVSRHNELLIEQVGRDELTGLYNRHHLTEFIARYEQDALADRRAYALIMTDIDHFKAINDRYGHDIGDKVLHAFSSCLKKRVRKKDLVCRWGGEEFIIIMQKCTLQKATAKAEAIRMAVADMALAKDLMQPISITASFGVTLHTPEERFDKVLSRADKLLYQAKESGRNCVVVE